MNNSNLYGLETSSRIAPPTNPWLILLSLFLALIANFIPRSPIPYIPDWVALVLCFWCVYQPRFISLGTAFILGLLMDVADGSILGQHALPYVILAWCANYLSRRVLSFQNIKQAIHILPLLVGCQVLQISMQILAGGIFPGWEYFISPVLATIAWLPLSYFLMLAQIRRMQNYRHDSFGGL